MVTYSRFVLDAKIVTNSALHSILLLLFFLSLDSESVQFFAISLGMMNLRPAEQKSPAGRAVISASRQTSLLSSLCL